MVVIFSLMDLILDSLVSNKYYISYVVLYYKLTLVSDSDQNVVLFQYQPESESS